MRKRIDRAGFTLVEALCGVVVEAPPLSLPLPSLPLPPLRSRPPPLPSPSRPPPFPLEVGPLTKISWN